jgi:flagellar biosynthetic protein FlhB
MAEQDLDRNEAATPFKLQRARERGAVAKNPDVSAFAILTLALVASVAWLPGATVDYAALMRQWLGHLGSDLGDAATAAAFLSVQLAAVLKPLAPLFLGVVGAAVLANLLQTGPVLSVEPLRRDFARMNPAQGFKKLVSVRLVYEAIKSTLKFGLLGGVLAATLMTLVPGVTGLVLVHSHAYLPVLYGLAVALLAKLLAALFVPVAIDQVYVRREYARRMRMSRREIKDEYKQREGDPRIRQRIRELRFQMLKRSQAMHNLPNADVLVTNPMRVAVAISYQHGVSLAPRVIAKGAGGLARRMRDVAFRCRVPIVQSPPLARALYRQIEAGGYVPEEWYPQVAQILVWARAARRGGAEGVA